MEKIECALIQESYGGDRERKIEKTLKKIESAEGANLIVLQELHTSEYFCQSQNVDFFDYASNFEREKEIFSEAAKRANAVVVSSLFEKRDSGIYHNSAVVFDRDGSEAGIYRKMHIPDDPQFYEKFYFTPGDLGFKPIETSIGKLGVLICWDQWYPEAARLMALQGAKILIYPTAIGWLDSDSKEEKNRQRDAWMAVQRGHAVANGVFVLTANRVGFEKDSSRVSDGIRFWGSSFIYGPQGEEIALGSSNKEEIVRATLNLKRVDETRRIWPFFRDRRIESYKGLKKRYLA